MDHRRERCYPVQTDLRWTDNPSKKIYQMPPNKMHNPAKQDNLAVFGLKATQEDEEKEKISLKKIT
jgi:hypothetical protein